MGQDPGQERGLGKEQGHSSGQAQGPWLRQEQWQEQGQALRAQVLEQALPGRRQALRGQVPGQLPAPGLLLKSLQAPPLPVELLMELEPALAP